MTYQEALDFLYPLQTFGIKPGLETTQELMKRLGRPDEKLGIVIHIAGTNGKGSTSAMMASICQEAGLKTALYTSPHLSDFTERIRINGIPISEEAVAHFTAVLKPAIEELNATFFEATTAIAFAYFASERVDVSVIEVGMGGRLDATNVVTPDYTAITAIGLDHQAYLGDTTEKIAAEKAGIIKPGVPVIIGVQELDALEVLYKTAKERKSRVILSTAVSRTTLSESSLNGVRFHIVWNKAGKLNGGYYGLELPFSGLYQLENARIAVIIAELMKLEETAIRQGLLKTMQNTGHRARLEVISRSPTIILDVSHNPQGIAYSIKTLANERGQFQQIYVLFGAMSDKDCALMLYYLSRFADKVFLCTVTTPRAETAEALSQAFHTLVIDRGEESLKDKITVGTSPSDTFMSILSAAKPEDMILITGSFYLIGELLDHPQLRSLMQKGTRSEMISTPDPSATET